MRWTAVLLVLGISTAFICFGCTNTTPPITTSDDDPMINQIRQNAKLVQDVARDDLGIDIDFDQSGVEWLDGYVNRQRENGAADNADGLVSTLGSFYGECIVQTYGGEWHQDASGWCVRFDEENAAYPFAKLQKQLENGPEDSVLSMFELIPIVFKRPARSE